VSNVRIRVIKLKNIEHKISKPGTRPEGVGLSEHSEQRIWKFDLPLPFDVPCSTFDVFLFCPLNPWTVEPLNPLVDITPNNGWSHSIFLSQ
jgi:hypothetical protein